MLRGQVPQSFIEQVAQITVVALFRQSVGTFNESSNGAPANRSVQRRDAANSFKALR